ncbi:MAG TPA: hypothetical protein IAB13_02755, partial [Candidatus Avanaerovorax faecigallinarum]|nr:hypothetical protein [Candidatus Avanaerovorax faecigallinarum]
QTRRKSKIVARSCQTALRVARVPRGARAMPASEKPRVSRGDGFLFAAGIPGIERESSGIRFFIVI